MLDFSADTRGILPPSRAVPQVLLDSVHVAQCRCSPATARALNAARLVRASGGAIPVLLATVAAHTNIAYAYFALSLSPDEWRLVEAGFESLGSVIRRRRREAYQAVLPVPVAQSAVVELHFERKASPQGGAFASMKPENHHARARFVSAFC